MPLHLYPNSAKRDYDEKNKDGFSVFKNGERLINQPSPVNNPSVFWSQFHSPVYRIPAAVITDNGRIIVATDFRSGPQDQIAITPAVAFSDDNGKTWNKKLIDLEPLANNANCRVMDPTMFIYKGVINIICGSWNGTTNNINWTKTRNDATWSVVRYYSNDNGETWYRENHFEKSIKTGAPTDGSSWLGGVGNAVVTKFGTCVVPIQISRAVNTVSMSCIYTNDGVNWHKFSQDVSGLSETSLVQWINTSGQVEIAAVSRRDPNKPENKAVNYTVQRDANGFSAFAAYGIYSNKIRAMGPSGCHGGAMMLCDETGNYSVKQNMLVSYAFNAFHAINDYTRDHINIAMFAQKQYTNNNSRQIRDIDTINLKMGAFENMVGFGGYSNICFNGKCNKLGIVYEDMLGISYKSLDHLIPTLKYEGAK